jgi:hypothetical protein
MKKLVRDSQVRKLRIAWSVGCGILCLLLRYGCGAIHDLSIFLYSNRNR